MSETVLSYPDPRLRRKAKQVDEITPELAERARGLFAVMAEEGGLGLAAPQVGWDVRLFVVAESHCDVHPHSHGPIALVNPEIVESGGGIWTVDEGCLSLPGINGRVRRAKKVKVRYTDLAGEQHVLEADGILGRCILHEIDHLDGVLFIDRLSVAKRHSLKGKLRGLLG